MKIILFALLLILALYLGIQLAKDSHLEEPMTKQKLLVKKATLNQYQEAKTPCFGYLKPTITNEGEGLMEDCNGNG